MKKSLSAGMRNLKVGVWKKRLLSRQPVCRFISVFHEVLS